MHIIPPHGHGSESQRVYRVSVADNSVRSADALEPTHQVNPSLPRPDLIYARVEPRSKAAFHALFWTGVKRKRARVPFQDLNHGLWSETKATCQTLPLQ